MKKCLILKPFSDALATNGERGATAVIVAITLAMLLGFCALAVDVGYLYATRNELQNVADAAALAAARELGIIYENIPDDEVEHYDVTDDRGNIETAARGVAVKNQAAGTEIVVNSDDIIISRWDGDKHEFELPANPVRPNAVRVIARRDSSANDPVATFFAKVLNLFGGDHDTVALSARATAALTGKGESVVGEVDIPIGISRYYFDKYGEDCLENVEFHPSNDPRACAGWNTFTRKSASDSTLRDILQGLRDGADEPVSSPETTTGKTKYRFTGGTLSKQTFDVFLTLFQEKGYDVDEHGNRVGEDGAGEAIPLFDENGERRLYPDGTERNKHEWEARGVIYEAEDCSNPNQEKTIVGFADMVITDVLNSPEKKILAKVKCFVHDGGDGRGGGGMYGVFGPIPGLVE